MVKFKKYIKNHRDEILMGLLLSLGYLFVIGLTYAILDYNLGAGIVPFLFSTSVYALETLIYLTMLSYVFQGW
ncbi:hypothetical protein [Streptococcus parasanguinis]|uniref:hypothetical protein n=1 Tax=Streptococcus parasanguinis TaxID=1318 RepID=UPI0020016608|nr:hypothetical protein [Streptococcus parasanguinis]